MKPETLISLSGAKGVGIPKENRSPIVDLLKRSPRTARGRQNGARLAPEWTHAECAQACGGIENRYFYAMRYSYALDDSVYSMLRLWLWEWALERREKENWPPKVATVYGHQRFLMPLVECALVEEVNGGRVPIEIDVYLGIDHGMHYTSPERAIRSTLGLTQLIFDRRVSLIYEAIRTEYITWKSIGEGMMRRKLRTESEVASC